MRLANVRRLLFVCAAAAGLALCAGTSSAQTANPTCGRPLSSGDIPTATDALFVLQSAVGTVECGLFTCDLDASCAISASDALVALSIAVGQDLPLACATGCSIGGEFSRVEIEIDPLDTDTVTLEGTFAEFPFRSTTGFIVKIDEIEFIAETETFETDSDENVFTLDAPDAAGISSARIDFSARTFEITLEKVFAASLPNPLAVQFEFADTTECRIVQLSEAAPSGSNASQRSLATTNAQAMPCTFEDATALPRTLVVDAVPSVGGLTANAGPAGPSTKTVELRITTAEGAELPEGAVVQVRPVLSDGSISEASVCTMTELDPTPSSGVRTFTCAADLQTRDEGTGDLIRHELVHVASGSDGTLEALLSESIEIRTVEAVESTAAAATVLESAGTIWDTALSLANDQSDAEVEAARSIRMLDGVHSVSLGPDAISIETESGVLGTIPLFTSESCAENEGECTVRCGGSESSTSAALRSARKDRIEAKRRIGLRRDQSMRTAPRTTGSDDGPVVVTPPRIVIWDPDYFGANVETFQDASSRFLLDKSLAGRQVEADRTKIRELVEATQCPRFEVVEYVGAAATIEAFRENATSAGLFVIVTHGSIAARGANVLHFQTRVDFDAAAEATYARELQEKQLVASRVSRFEYRLGIAPAFIGSLNGEFDDTIVWAGACHSGANSYPRQSDAFLAKGASNYFGFTQSVTDKFGRLAGELAYDRLLAQAGTTDEAFADVIPKLDPLLSEGKRPLPRRLSPRRILDPERTLARLVLESSTEATFLGDPELEAAQEVLATSETTAITVSLEGSATCSDLIYRWSNTATVGTLEGVEGGRDVFDSASPEVDFVASDTEFGIDTVQVEILVVEDDEERSLGTASIDIEVVSECVACSIDPAARLGDGRTPDCESARELCCRDGVDNDDDGATDCDDTDCGFSEIEIAATLVKVAQTTSTGRCTAAQFWRFPDVPDADWISLTYSDSDLGQQVAPLSPPFDDRFRFGELNADAPSGTHQINLGASSTPGPCDASDSVPSFDRFSEGTVRLVACDAE